MLRVAGSSRQDLGFCFLSISCPLGPRIETRAEAVETGDPVDSKKRQENQAFPANPMETSRGLRSVG